MNKAPQPGSAAWEALGTTVVLRVTDPEALAPARQAVGDELGAIDLALAAFAPTPSSRVPTPTPVARSRPAPC